MNKYKVIEAKTIGILKKRIEEELASGWKLVGGVSATAIELSRGNYIEKFYQAMAFDG